MKLIVNFTLGLTSLAPSHERVHQPVHFRDGIAADHPEDVRFRHAAGDHPGEVRGLLDVVVEHREVGLLRLAGRAHQERHLRIVLRDLARHGFHGERLADDEGVALLRVLAHHALVIGVADVLGELVLDLTAGDSGVQRLVDARHPLLLDRHRVDGRDLHLLLRERRAGAQERRCEGERRAGAQHSSSGVM